MLRWLFGGAATKSPSHRVYAVGDIQGCSKTLSLLLPKIHADARRHIAKGGTAALVLAGDYCDRGPDAFGVFEQCIAEKARRDGIERHFLMGNHDYDLGSFLTDEISHNIVEDAYNILHNGGLQTFASYGIDAFEAYVVTRQIRRLQKERKREDIEVASDEETQAMLKLRRLGLPLKLALIERVPQSHVAFLQSLELSYQTPDLFICHAGIEPDKPLSEQNPHVLIGIDGHLADKNGKPPSRVFAGGHKGSLEGITVAHGHTIVGIDHLERIIGKKHPKRVPLDTGACAGGHLTAGVFEGGRLVEMISQRAVEEPYDPADYPDIRQMVAPPFAERCAKAERQGVPEPA